MSQGRVQRSRLLGRRSECEALDRLVTDALAGRSRVIVLRGEAGVGKSALLDYLSERVAGWHVARAVGVESEMELAYSGLHQLCGPMLDHLDRLPDPAARSARDGVRPERRPCAGPVPGRAGHADAVRRGRRAAAARLHRRRRAVARPRLRADPRFRRPPAPRRADRARVRSTHGHRRRRPRRAARVVHRRARRQRRARAAAGQRVRPARCGGLRPDRHREPRQSRSRSSSCRAPGTSQISPAGSGCPTANRWASKIEQSYVRRLRLLPSETQLLVLAAAAEPLGDPVLLHRAAETLGIDMAAADPAVDAGLLKIGGRVEFAHPLVRSAAYRSAAAEDRHRVHRALAEATDPRDGPGPARLAPRPSDAGTWRGGRRRARAFGRPGAGSRRSRRGGRVPAARRRTDTWTRRGVRSARWPRRRRASRPGRSTRLSGSWPAREAGPLDEFQRARADLLRGHVAFASGLGSDAPPLLLSAGRRLEPFDLELARQTYLTAWFAAVHAGPSRGRVTSWRSAAPSGPFRSLPGRRALITCCSMGSRC